MKIKVGSSEIQKTRITIDNDQKWTSHFWGKKGLIQGLNQRMFAIKRISNHITKDIVKHLVNSIWMSKLRYGLQLTHKVRLTDEDRKRTNSKATQITQNKVLRLTDGSRL